MTTKYQWLPVLIATLGAAALVGCMEVSQKPQEKGQVSVKPFGQTKDGTPVSLYTLRNDKGAEAGICNYGGIVVFLKMPDREATSEMSCSATTTWRITSRTALTSAP